MAENQHDKTEQPTVKRRREARDKGRIARSHDLTMAVTLLGVTGALGLFGSAMMRRLGTIVAEGLTSVGQMATREISAGDLVRLLGGGALGLVTIVGPVAGVAVAVAVAAGAAQAGLHMAPAALRWNWGALNPVSGLKRLAPIQAGPNTLRALMAATVLGVLAWRIGKPLAVESARFPWMAPSAAAARGWAETGRFLWQGAFALLAIGAADFGLQRWRLTTSLKMTKREVRDEARLNDGNPEIKARVRKTQREMTRRRMLRAAAKATVVITNPTHYAVALEYRREKSPAPIVVAKGRDLVAQRIRQIARENGVPIVENPPLARALHKTAEVGDTIPADLFGAVAEVLAYLIRIKQLML
jgi:flagellar biosynthetic protein FlhB